MSVMEYELLNGADLQTIDALMQMIKEYMRVLMTIFQEKLYVPMSEYCEDVFRTEIQAFRRG